MNAINGRHKQIIHYLLSRGADPNIKSTSGRTSYDIAKRVDILNNLDSIAFHNMKLRKKEKEEEEEEEKKLENEKKRKQNKNKGTDNQEDDDEEDDEDDILISNQTNNNSTTQRLNKPKYLSPMEWNAKHNWWKNIRPLSEINPYGGVKYFHLLSSYNHGSDVNGGEYSLSNKIDRYGRAALNETTYSIGMRCDDYRLLVQMKVTSGYNYISNYCGTKYKHTDENHQINRQHVLQLLKQKKLKEPTEEEIKRMYLHIKRQEAVKYENEQADRELKEMRLADAAEAQRILEASDTSLIKSLPLQSSMIDINNNMIRTYGKRISINEKYFSFMMPSRIHGGIYKGMTLHQNTMRYDATKWWLEKNNGKKKKEQEQSEEKNEENKEENKKEKEEEIKEKEKMQQEKEKEKQRLLSLNKRVQPFVYERNASTVLHRGIYKGILLHANLSKKRNRIEKEEKDETDEKDKNNGINKNKKNDELSPKIRCKYTITMVGTNSRSRVQQFLRRSETHQLTIDVSSEEDEYQHSNNDNDDNDSNSDAATTAATTTTKPSNHNSYNHPNALPWRKLLILRLFKPIEYVIFNGNINMSITDTDITNARLALPTRLGRPKKQWWSKFCRQLYLYINKKKVIYQHQWYTATKEKEMLQVGFYSDKYQDKGINLHDHPNITTVNINENINNNINMRHTVMKGKTLSKNQTKKFKQLKQNVIETERYKGVRVHNGIYKGMSLIQNIVHGISVWSRSRTLKEPGFTIPKYKEVRRPRIPLNHGIYKNRTMLGDWRSPHRARLHAPRLHNGITIGQNGKYIHLHGGLRLLSIPVRRKDLLNTRIQISKYRHSIQAKLKKRNKLIYLKELKDAIELKKQKDIERFQTNSRSYSRGKSGRSRESRSRERSRNGSRNGSRPNSRPNSKPSSRSPSRNSSRNRSRGRQGKKDNLLETTPRSTDHLKSYVLFRKAWFHSITVGDLIQVQQLIQTAQTGRMLSKQIKLEIGGLYNLLRLKTKRSFMTGLHIAVQKGHVHVAVSLMRLGCRLDWCVGEDDKNSQQEKKSNEGDENGSTCSSGSTMSSSGDTATATANHVWYSSLKKKQNSILMKSQVQKNVLDLAKEYDLNHIGFRKNGPKPMKMTRTLLAIQESVDRDIQDRKRQMEKKKEEKKQDEQKQEVDENVKKEKDKSRSGRSVFKGRNARVKGKKGKKGGKSGKGGKGGKGKKSKQKK